MTPVPPAVALALVLAVLITGVSVLLYAYTVVRGFVMHRGVRYEYVDDTPTVRELTRGRSGTVMEPPC